MRAAKGVSAPAEPIVRAHSSWWMRSSDRGLLRRRSSIACVTRFHTKYPSVSPWSKRASVRRAATSTASSMPYRLMSVPAVHQMSASSVRQTSEASQSAPLAPDRDREKDAGQFARRQFRSRVYDLLHRRRSDDYPTERAAADKAGVCC